MMNLPTLHRAPWSVIDELEALQAEMSRALAGQGERDIRFWRPQAAFPPVNVWTSANGVIIDAELPGVDPKEIELSVVDDELTLQGELRAPELGKDETLERRERPVGAFARTLRLPFRAEAGAVKAHYRNGVLRLTVPRPAEQKPRKIEIEAA